jgi:tRNA isopentenyl-2-thiomethyl-A-37 hydroxylase MiaE
VCGDESLAGLFKDEVDEIVEELVRERLRYFIIMLDKYYVGHIEGAGRHFSSYFGFVPNVNTSKTVSDRGIKISIEIEIPDNVVEKIRKEVRKEVLRSKVGSS